MNSIEKPTQYTSAQDLPQGVKVIDTYESAIQELFTVEHPSVRREDPTRGEQIVEFVKNTTIPARYVYYPWRNIAVRTVDEATYLRLRTARNKTIINEEEQQAYRNCTVGVVGMSVGSSAIRAMVSSGGPKILKIADFDTLEVTNLNRISAGLPDIGGHKADLVAKFVWELDPDAELEIWREGVTPADIEKFITEPKLAVFVDEMDNLVLKFAAREICKRHGIPVLMATDNGDSVILDIERFDLEPEREIFHGLVPDITPETMSHLPFQEWVKVATKIVGPDFLTDRMQEAIMSIGRTIPAVPQLGPTAAMAGAGIAFAVRRIASKQPLPSGRYTYGLDEKLIPGYSEPAAIAKRQETAEQMKAAFGGKA
jgi:hypothetical protein